MKEKEIFVASSRVDKIKCYVINIVILFAVVYCSININENPILISLIICILLIVLLMSGYSQIKIFADRVEIITRGLTKYFTVNKKIYFNEISSIDANLKFDQSTFILSEVLTSYIAINSWNTLEFKLTDGTKKIFNLKLYKLDITEAILYIKKLSNNKVAISGI